MKTARINSVGSTDIFLNVLVFVVYLMAGKFGLTFAAIHPSASAIWPPTGISLAACLLLGIRVWPAIFIGAFLVNITTAGSQLTSLAIALGNTLEAVIGARLVMKYANGRQFIDQTNTVFKFLTIIAFFAIPISATLGVTALSLGGFAPWELYRDVWVTWWLGDLGGAYILTPFILLWSKRRRTYTRISTLVKITLLFTMLILSTTLVFGPNTLIKPIYGLTFLPLPFLYWISYLTNSQLSSLAILINVALAVLGTQLGFGPFANGIAPDAHLFLQIYLNIIATSTLIFSVTVDEKNKLDKRYHSLIDHSFDVIALIDAKANILYSSNAAERILGFTTRELSRFNGFDLIHPDDQPETKKKLEKLLQLPGGNVTAEYRMRRKNNEWIWVEATGTNLLNDPDVETIVLNYRDITDKKISQNAIRESQLQLKDERDRLDTIIQSIADGVIVTDKNFHITVINNAATRLLNCSADYALGKNIADIAILLKDDKVVPQEERYYFKAYKTGKPVVTQLQDNYAYKTRIGKVIPVIISVAPLFDNETTGVVNVFRDVTDIKALDKAKSDFLSLAAHQLRTPLGINRWHLEMLLHSDYGSLTEKIRGVVGKMYSNNSRLISLVGDLLNVTRIDQNKAANNPEDLPVVKVIQDVIDEIKDSASADNINVIMETDIDKDLKMKLDPTRFRVVIQNILSNAVKYSLPNGKVLMRIFVQNGELTVQCKDTGIGIPEEGLGKISTKFYRAPNAVLRDAEGSGLGLYVVKSYVEEWKGKLNITSKEGSGTEVTVSIPIDRHKLS